MALRGTLTHWKTRVLAESLGIEIPHAMGLLEALWHTTAEDAPSGNIGRLSNKAIAMQMFTGIDPDQLIAALVASGHLDEHPEYRLLVHDWHLHTDYNTKRKVARFHGQMHTVDGDLPPITRHDASSTVSDRIPEPEPEPEPEPVIQIQKPSRAKAARATKSALADERHTAFKEAIKTYWDSKNSGLEMPWGPMEGKQLGMWLREAPHITLDQFTGFLRARFKSDVNHGERPSQWIKWVTSYGGGPIDRFGKPIQENGNGTNRPSATHQRVVANRAALGAALARRGVNPACFAGGADVSALPEPRPDGLPGGVLVGFRTVGAEILPRQSDRGIGGAQAQAGPELLSKAR